LYLRAQQEDVEGEGEEDVGAERGSFEDSDGKRIKLTGPTRR
jgi:hypothetical protein